MLITRLLLSLKKVRTQLNRMRNPRERKQTQVALTSQLCHNFQASRAVHGADEMTTL